MKLSRDVEPIIAIKGNWVYQYAIVHGNFPRHKRENSRPQLDKSATEYSCFGKCAKRELMRTLTNWTLTQEIASDVIGFQSSRSLKKHTFATLTLPASQMHDDKVIKREIFNKTLINLGRRFDAKNYLWKAEVQKNSNIHFHVLLDRYIPHQELRAVWNKALQSLEYIDRFKQLHGHDNPNSTDIHSLQKTKNIRAYIAKYVSKEIEGRNIDGHAWGRSDNLKKLIPYTFTEDYQLLKWLEDEKAKNKHAIYSNEFTGITKFESFPDIKSMPYVHYQRLLEITRSNLKVINRS